MANFIVLVDEDKERGSRFIKQVQPRLRIVDGLLEGSCAHGNFWAVWAASKRAPISHLSDGEGAAVLWGEAIPGPGPERLDAAGLRDRWQELSPEQTAYDGYYAGAVYGPDRGLMVGADLLGFFPVYYWSANGVVLVGSSPELFRYHPAFRLELNPAGLVGILLTNGLIDGQTLLKGVRRLNPGHVLVWRRGSLKEVSQYAVPTSMHYYNLPFETQLEVLDETLQATTTRHVPEHGQLGLLLSGGLDSRLLSGYLDARRVNVKALTLGLRTDIDVRCAKGVARALDFKHSIAELEEKQNPEYAFQSASWEQLSGGFNTLNFWGLYRLLQGLPDHVMSGLALDSAIAPYLLHKQTSCQVEGNEFDNLLKAYNSWGVNSGKLERLLVHEPFPEIIPAVVERIRTIYNDKSTLNSHKAWRFQLQHRARFHTGSVAWLLSFGSWPVLPALDRQLLEVAGAMPLATIGERRAEIALVCNRFPQLASLPLDRNSYNAEPLKPRLRYLLQRYARNVLHFRQTASTPSTGAMERRRYYRTFDFNAPGWRAVRAAAEPYRARTFSIFDERTLRELLPGPEIAVSLKEAIAEASGLKLLTGFFLWSRGHL